MKTCGSGAVSALSARACHRNARKVQQRPQRKQECNQKTVLAPNQPGRKVYLIRTVSWQGRDNPIGQEATSTTPEGNFAEAVLAGTIAVTRVPLFPDSISRCPPNCRTLSPIP